VNPEEIVADIQRLYWTTAVLAVAVIWLMVLYLIDRRKK
jgi:hypothetical protein